MVVLTSVEGTVAPPTTLIIFRIVKAIPLSRLGDPAASPGFTSDLLPPGPPLYLSLSLRWQDFSTGGSGIWWMMALEPCLEAAFAH